LTSSVPISDTPRRPRGHRLAGSRTDRKLTSCTSCDVHPVFTHATETAAPPCLSAPSEPQSGCLPSYRDHWIAPVHWLHCAVFLENALQPLAPFSPRSRRGVRQHVMRSSPRPASLRRLALRLLERRGRAMRRTNFCHLTFLVPVPAPRRFSMRHAAFAARAIRGACLMHVSANSLWRVARGPLVGDHRGGRCLPAVMRAYRASDTPVASPAAP